MGKKNINKLIDYEDMNIIKKIAQKYNMNVGDFGRTIVREAKGNTSRIIRTTDEEFEIISKRANKYNSSVSHWCALACSDFLKKEKEEDLILKLNTKVRSTKIRKKKFGVKILNKKEEFELIEFATANNLKVASLIRYCSLNFKSEDD